MKGKWLAGSFLMIFACSGPAAPPSTASSTVRTLTPSPSVKPINGIDFSCVLPVYGYTGMSTGAFMSFPAGRLTPASESGNYYDRTVSRWLPVNRTAVSPDGLRYAYTEGWSLSPPPTAPRLHIADAATRTDLRVATMPDAQPYQVAEFTASGIYLVISSEGIAPGVWRFDPATGAVVKVSNGFYTPSGATWIGVVDARDPNPQRSAFSGQAQPDRIDRRDDAGQTTTWFYVPGYALSWATFIGPPALLINAFYQDSSTGAYQVVYWLVDAPGHATRLPGQPPDFFGAGFGNAIADAHGIWIGSPAALYLARRDGAILRVFDSSLYPANGCL